MKGLSMVAPDEVRAHPPAAAPGVATEGPPSVAARAPRPGLRYRLEYAAFRGVAALVRWLPEAAALALAGLIGDLAGRVVRVRRHVVDANLARAFPGRPRRWRSRVAVASYRHLARETATFLRMDGMDPDEVRQRTVVEGLDAVREAMEQGRGAVIVTGHFGNWEIGGAALAARGLPTDVVAVRQNNPLFDRDLVAMRERFGMRVLEKRKAPRRALGSLRAGRVVALVADQNVHGGVFVDFFGVPAATARGPALFACRVGSPVFLGIALRLPGAAARYRVLLREISLHRGGLGQEAIARLTQAHQSALEEWVRAEPTQYFWHHRRWKTRPCPGPEGAEAARNRPPAVR